MPHLSRRTTLRAAAVGGLVGVVGLSGCEMGDRGSKRRPAPQNATTAPPDRDGDRLILDDARAAVLAAAELARATAQRHRALRGRLKPLRATHASHLERLAATDPTAETPLASAPTTSTSTPMAPRLPAALAAVRKAEVDLADALAESAVRAASGDFARLLASMSAATEQQVALLTTPDGAENGAR